MNLSQIINAKSAKELKTQFPSEDDCENFLHEVRWSEGIRSPFDPLSKVYKCQGNRYRCKNSKKYFNIKTDTLFHNSKIPLPIWFEAIWIVAHSTKITSVALAAELKLTQKTAWYMLRRIRRFLVDNNLKPIILQSEVNPVAPAISPPERLNLTEWLSLLKNKQ